MSTRDRLSALADGTRTADELSQMLGVGRKRILRLCNQMGLACRKPQGKHRAEYEERVRKIREMAALNKIAVEMAEALGIHEKSVREICNREGIKFRRKPYVQPAKKQPRRPAATAKAPRTVKNAPVRGGASSVAEWIALYGPPQKFEAGTLDQILHDTFHAVGKRFQRTSGNGSSWKPYLLNGKAVSAVDAIRAANEIRAARGMPLLSEPRRRAA